MTDYAQIRKEALDYWKTRSKRVIGITDDIYKSIECTWQRRSQELKHNHKELKYNHISVFCSIGEFASHLTDLLRDYRYDRYNYDQSEEVNELLFRYYSRVLLIVSEMLTDFQDLYIIADNKITTKELKGKKTEDKRKLQDNARKELSNGTQDIQNIMDFINKICKHKTPNFHLCNHHIQYLFEDFHKDVQNKRKKIEIGNIDQYTSYDDVTLKKHHKPNFLVIPKLKYVVDLVINSYTVLDNLFTSDSVKFDHTCKQYNTDEYDRG